MKPWTPPEKSHVIRTRNDAKRYVREYETYLKRRAGILTEDIRNIEEEDLRLTVAFTVEFLAQGYGNFTARPIETLAGGYGSGMHIAHFELDSEGVDALELRFGADKIEEAGRWLLARLNGESSIFIAWALGPIFFEGASHENVLEHRILYNLKNREFVAVYSHYQWDHPQVKRHNLS